MTRHASSPLRLLAALAIVIGISAVPIAQVAACSCMALGPEEAAQMSDVVFAGTVVGEAVGAIARACEVTGAFVSVEASPAVSPASDAPRTRASE